MRVLIYGETEAAQTILATERDAGNHASLRTADFDLFDEKSPEPCDKVHCWDAFVVHAYEGKADVEYHGAKISDEEAIVANDGEDVTAVTPPVTETESIAAKPKRPRKK